MTAPLRREHDCDHCRHWQIPPALLGDFADVIEGLPSILKAFREMRAMSQRAAAKEIGVSFSTISRIEDGQDFAAKSAAKVVRWITHGSDQ